jgi:Transposase IS116/IS110/IS902 family
MGGNAALVSAGSSPPRWSQPSTMVVIFRSGRELAAWIGLVPRQHTTGGKPRLGGIGQRVDHYLRRQMLDKGRRAGELTPIWIPRCP